MSRIIRNLVIFLLSVYFLILCGSPVYANGTKKLYFEQQNGKMVWNNVRGDDGNWFMSFTNMVPGGQYNDQLVIENGSKKTYALYMQVLPIQQNQKKDELLELISMKVHIGSKLIYEGTASGKAYNNGNLRNVIYLGTYQPGGTDKILVDLELNKNIGIEYCDLLTKIDWKFMVTEIQNPKKADNPKNPGKDTGANPPQTIQPPKTGDTSNISMYIAAMACASGLIMILTRCKTRRT